MNGKTSAETSLEGAIRMLLEALADKCTLVSDTAYTSLRKLSKSHSNAVVHSACNYCKKHTSINAHKALILQLTEDVCTQQIINLDGDTVLVAVEFCVQFITENLDYDPIVQMPASGVLVALGRHHHIQVMDALLKKMEPGTVPHYMIPHTLGALTNANAYGVIPYLKDILTVMLPLLGGLKSDPLKQSFSYALQNFSEGLLEYVSNIDQTPDNTVTLDEFTVEFAMAYDVLFSSWLTSREPKVTECVLNALAAIFPLLSVEKVTQHATKSIQTLLNLYRRNNLDTFNVTKCLYAIVLKSTSVNGTLLEPLLNNILNSFADLVCVSPDYAHPDSLRTHSEILRCYECLAVHFTDHTIDKLLIHLRNNNEKERIKGLIILTHLVSYSGEQTIHRRFGDILKQLNEMLSDGSIRVKKVLVKLILALAYKKVIIINGNISNSETTDKYIEFVIKMCCKQAVSKNSDITTEELLEIQKSSDNALYMLTTSLPDLECSVWKLLMKCFLASTFDEAVVVLLRCLTHLAAKKEKVIEHCEAAFVRCLALLSNPVPSLRGTYVLNFLKTIKPCEIESYKTVWDTQIPHLIKYLEQNYDNLNVPEWHSLLIDFLNLLLENVKSESFSEILSYKAKEQLEVYNNNRNNGELATKQCEKQFLLKCMATMLCYLKTKETITQGLENILINVKITDYSELHACAEAVGICSHTHLELVLEKMAHIRKEVLTKRSSKLFSFIKDQKHDIGIERLRYVIICSYAEICNRAPGEQLLRIIESEILDFVINELSISRDFIVKKACLRSIQNIADALHPNRNLLHIHMTDRDKVIDTVTAQMHLHNGPEYIELFPIIIAAVTSLIKLPQPLELKDRNKLLTFFFQNVYNASAIYCKIKPNTNELNSINSDTYYGELKLVPYVTRSFLELNQFVQQLLMQNLSHAMLDEVVSGLVMWLGKKKAEQRLPAVETLRTVLQTYLDNVKFAYDCPSYGNSGYLLSRVVPRCTDPNNNIRKVAVECICLTLCITSRYEGNMRDHDKLLTDPFRHIQQNIESDDPKLLYNLTTDLSTIIYGNLPHTQVLDYIYGLIDSLLDCESSSSNGAGIALQLTLKNKGGEVQSHVTYVATRMLEQLYKIECVRTRSSTMRGVFNLATHHMKAVVDILLRHSLPYDSSICECWSIMSSDEALTSAIIDYLKKIIKGTPFFEKQGKDKSIKMANLPPLEAVSALNELLKNQKLKDVCLKQFAELFAILLIALASYIGTQTPATNSNGELNREAYKIRPSKVATETFRLFLLCCGFNQMAAGLLTLPTETGDESTIVMDITAKLVDNISVEYPQSLSWVVAALGPYIRADLEPQRAAVVSFFTALLKHGAGDQPVLMENLLEMILDVQLDESCLVRKIGLKGLGYAAENLDKDLISQHCNAMLSLMMNSLDYNHTGIKGELMLEGMLSFSKLLNSMHGFKFSTFQVTAAVRIKPLLSQENINLRSASIRLFGDLTQTLTAEANIDAFKEQIHGNLITLLLHLYDTDTEVIKACKYTLRKIGPYLDSTKVNCMIQEHLIDEANLHYKDFTKDLIKVMADDLQDLFPLLIMTSLVYLESRCVQIRSNAVLITGILYAEMTEDSRSKVSFGKVCDRLMKLLGDENEDVRIEAAQAIAALFVN